MTFKRHYILNLALLFPSFFLVAFSQTGNYKYQLIGQPFIKYYTSKEYKSNNSNWCIVQDKLFNPFFTTKPTGEGTSLGLSISYDIVVKQHLGEIRYETKNTEFTEFIITILKT